MRCADEVFSVAMGAQAALLRRACKRPVRYVPHVAPLHFLDATPADPTDAITMVGKRLTYFGVELIPDDRQRAVLISELTRVAADRLAVYGKGWRGPRARGPVPFNDQLNVMQRSLITVGWDRYRSHPGYFSDRLPIALCAGRVHVTSRQPGLDWLPGPDHGLYLVNTPREAAAQVRELLAEDPSHLISRASALNTWARTHLTETQALLHMLGDHLPLPAAPADPWESFAALSSS